MGRPSGKRSEFANVFTLILSVKMNEKATVIEARKRPIYCRQSRRPEPDRSLTVGSKEQGISPLFTETE